MLMLSREEVLKIAKLARLSLSDDEVESYRVRMARVLDHVNELKEISLEHEELVKHIPRDAVAFREDMPITFADSDAILKNGPQVEDRQFLLPPIMEQG